MAISELAILEPSISTQSVMLFMKLTTLEINDARLENITLNGAGLFRFFDIETVTIKNLTLTNITCTEARSYSPPYLLDF